jgi:hypothetical protein
MSQSGSKATGDNAMRALPFFLPYLFPFSMMLGYLTGAAWAFQAESWLLLLVLGLQSVIGFSILEVINYIEHYGLTRREIAPGRYERVLPRHSWNSSHRISNWFLCNVARHSDHHYQAGRPYQTLRHIDDAPQPPAGYFPMFVLAFFPSLWRRVMDPLVEIWQRDQRAPAMQVHNRTPESRPRQFIQPPSSRSVCASTWDRLIAAC